ncbi:MAG TPA: PTS sugar transporter subunit IIB [Tepidanaerobacter syntrophicus]|uniref:PTS sugar transporter subunit IIB n=1 Tax=Tepidanaerobacter syntrophicus TaxID=224999 RepID=UPI00175931E3|nr:PTS sugar transporter subunit IIB [Tepidanaerobacter syntrophicus]HHV83629.1 PTS sugar transporter subunit IIB [Tepidanaerobacter syntrophicus]
MPKKTIMLVCAAGMSTSLMVSKMKKAAESTGLDVEILSAPANQLEAHLKNKHIDVVLLAPQVRYKKDEITAKCASKNIPVETIDMQDYGTINGENVLNLALKLIE